MKNLAKRRKFISKKSFDVELFFYVKISIFQVKSSFSYVRVISIEIVQVVRKLFEGRRRIKKCKKNDSTKQFCASIQKGERFF